jgi:hypothetical protein
VFVIFCFPIYVFKVSTEIRVYGADGGLGIHTKFVISGFRCDVHEICVFWVPKRRKELPLNAA